VVKIAVVHDVFHYKSKDLEVYFVI